jgi:pyruvate-formate lyase
LKVLFIAANQNTAELRTILDYSFDGIIKLAEEDAVAKMAAFIRVIFERGATLLNINIIDRDKILSAHRDPSLYPDLVVRVTGFTAYFAMLSPEFRQLVVDRIISG